MKTHLMKNHRRGFTLVELMVTVAIIVVLAAAGFGGWQAIRKGAQRAVALQNMKQIGSVIPNYASDHGGRLPGAMASGQMALQDPAEEGQMVNVFGEYLGLVPKSKPVVVDLFMPPAFKSSGIKANTARTYVMNMEIQLTTEDSINPWGTISIEDNPQGNPEEFPVPLARVPEDAWAFSDADRQHPRVKSEGWSSNTPAKPIHGKRLAWFFDGSVSSVDQDRVWRNGRRQGVQGN